MWCGLRGVKCEWCGVVFRLMQAEDYKDSFQKERASNKKLVLKKNQEMEDTIANLTENFNRERRKFGSKIGDLTRNNRELMERLNKLATTQCQNEFGEVSGWMK